jgi:hypothetical protein
MKSSASQHLAFGILQGGLLKRQRRDANDKKNNIPNTATSSSKLPASIFDARMVSNETMPWFSEKMRDVGVVTFAAGGVQPARSSTDILTVGNM